jgi:hypothetical protein
MVVLPMMSLELPILLSMIIPSGIAIFGLLVLAGAFPLWVLHRKEATILQSVPILGSTNASTSN